MKKYNIGFIGSGKMAGAIIKGLLKTNFAKPETILATQAESTGIEEKSSELGIKIILDNKELTQKSDIIFIATKPNQVVNVLTEIAPFITPEKLIVSIASGRIVSSIKIKAIGTISPSIWSSIIEPFEWAKQITRYPPFAALFTSVATIP